MRIAHIVDSMEVGGAEILVLQMCRLQREQGHDPTVYALAGLGALGEQMRSEGFTVQPNVGSHLTNATRAFFRLFKEAPPDAVHLHNPTPTIYAGPAARMAGVASIVSTRHSLVAPPRKTVTEIKYALAATFCDWVVGICDATTNNVREIHSAPSRKIIRVYNGTTSLPEVPKDKQPTKSGFTFVFVGRLEPVKNHGLLLHAFRIALSSMPDLSLCMVGDGSERKRLERLAVELGVAERVKFWGQQLHVAPFFSAADTFIMSSKSEGLPMSLLQGFSIGLPAIVTDVGGMAEVVRLAQAGYTVSPADAGEMADAMLRMASSSTERERFSAGGKAAFRAHFTLSAMVDGYMKLYRDTRRARVAPGPRGTA